MVDSEGLSPDRVAPPRVKEETELEERIDRSPESVVEEIF